MVDRYCSLEPTLQAIDPGIGAENDLDSLLLSRRENERVFDLCDDLDKMEGGTKALQQSTMSLSGVQLVFDHILSAYPQLKGRLGQTAAIVKNVPLECGFVMYSRSAIRWLT
jgi:hypothetical protein